MSPLLKYSPWFTDSNETEHKKSMAKSDNNKVGVNDYKRLSRQNNLLFLAGAISLLAGLLFPKIPALVDLLMIFSLALSASVIVICFRNRKPDELTGLPLLAVIAVTSLLTTAIASAKLLIIRDTGLITTHAARLNNIVIDALPTSLSAAAFTAVSIALLIFTAKSTSKLLLSSNTYLDEVAAVEQPGDEFNFATVENEQENLAAKEKGFLYAIHSFGSLALWLCVLISAVIMLSLFGAVLAGKTLISFATGAIVVIQLPAFLVVFAVSHLTCKIILMSSQRSRMTEEQFQQRIKVVAREVAHVQRDDYQTPLSSDIRPPTSPAPQQYKADDTPLFDCNDFDDEAAYDCMTNMLAESGAGKVLLMAGSGSQYAPVTIPVNVAVRLATRGLKTLIIDFDLKRSAVQRVFETGNCDSSAVKTCIENISLISGKRLASAKTHILRQLFTKAEKLYDHIIVYAPDAAVEQQMSEFFTKAMLFGAKNTSANQKLDNLIYELNKTACRMLTPSFLLQTA